MFVRFILSALWCIRLREITSKIYKSKIYKTISKILFCIIPEKWMYPIWMYPTQENKITPRMSMTPILLLSHAAISGLPCLLSLIYLRVKCSLNCQVTLLRRGKKINMVRVLWFLKMRARVREIFFFYCKFYISWHTNLLLKNRVCEKYETKSDFFVATLYYM